MYNLNNFEYLVGDKNISKKPTLPYNEIICNFLGDLSDELNLSVSSKYNLTQLHYTYLKFLV